MLITWNKEKRYFEFLGKKFPYKEFLTQLLLFSTKISVNKYISNKKFLKNPENFKIFSWELIEKFPKLESGIYLLCTFK